MTDSLDMLGALESQPEDFANAHELARSFDPGALPSADEVVNIVVFGMGDAGAAGDVLAAIAGPELAVPVAVVKDFDCPAFVGPGTLVFAVSYDGDTEETLTAVSSAEAVGAHVVAVTAGGELAARVAAHGGSVLGCLPGLLPRAALATFVVPMFVVLQRTGLWSGAHDALLAAETQLAKRRDLCSASVLGAANPARELARQLDRTFPLIYGGGSLGATAAAWWKCEMGRSAKVPAFWNTYPELDHNEICGWGQAGDVTRQVLSLVELRHDDERPEVARRVDATREIIREAVHQVLEVRAAGDGRLAQLLDLMYVGAWVSCYLALDNDVDPGPVPAIADLKRALRDDS